MGAGENKAAWIILINCRDDFSECGPHQSSGWITKGLRPCLLEKRNDGVSLLKTPWCSAGKGLETIGNGKSTRAYIL